MKFIVIIISIKRIMARKPSKSLSYRTNFNGSNYQLVVHGIFGETLKRVQMVSMSLKIDENRNSSKFGEIGEDLETNISECFHVIV